MKQPLISVVIISHEEGESLARTLSSVRWADEIVVIDSSDSGETRSVARRFTKHVYTQPNSLMLNRNKNYGFGKASGEWILSVDADEVVPDDLADEIRRTVHSGSNGKSAVGYWIARRNIIFGKWIQHGLWWPDKQLRLFRRGRGRFPEKHVHEYLAVDGPSADLTTSFIHYNYESIAQYLHKMTTIYTENEVENLLASGYQLSWYDAIRFPVSDLVKIYFAQEGYKDGLHGLVLALLQSFYSFLVFAKLWERRRFPESSPTLADIGKELRRSAREIHYWQVSACMKETQNPLRRLVQKLRRRYGTTI